MFLKKILIIFLILNFITPQVFALARCRYDYDGNKVCRHIKPEEISAAKRFRRVNMYDSKGRRVSIYLKKYHNAIRIINSHKHYIGTGFEDYRGNIHIVVKGKIVKTFYKNKRYS